jgi:hypothetical protein
MAIAPAPETGRPAAGPGGAPANKPSLTVGSLLGQPKK